jgi:hypothetical protein
MRAARSTIRACETKLLDETASPPLATCKDLNQNPDSSFRTSSEDGNA